MRISTGRAPRHKSARCVLRVECSYYHISVNDQCMSQARGLRAAAAPGGQPPPNLSLHGERRPVTLAETTVERGLWRGSLLSCSFIKALRFGESPRVWLSCGIARIEPPTYASALRRRCCTFLSAAWIGKMADYLCATCEVRPATRLPAVARGKATFAKARGVKGSRGSIRALIYTDDTVHAVFGVPRALRLVQEWRAFPLNEVGLMMAIPEKRTLGVWALGSESTSI